MNLSPQNDELEMKDLVIDIIQEFYSLFGVKYIPHENWNLLLHRYFAFRLKYITVGKRNIRVSRELSSKLDTHPAKDSCFTIFSTIINGIDINPYQGKGLINADFHDDMFNDWGIHHLHLNNTKNSPSDYFVKRSDYLLFVRCTDTIIYVLDIYLHKEKNIWGKKALIKIIHDNWPETIADKRVGRLYPDFSDEEVQSVRRKGYTFGINVDESTGYLLLGHGYATSGDNMMAGQLTNKVHRWMWQNEYLFKADKQEFIRLLREQLWFRKQS